jgi:hypothetical protein
LRIEKVIVLPTDRDIRLRPNGINRLELELHIEKIGHPDVVSPVIFGCPYLYRSRSSGVAPILDETLPSEVTLFDLASGTPLLWDEQRAQTQSVCRVVSLAVPDD